MAAPTWWLGIFVALPFTNSRGRSSSCAAAAGFATGFFRPASYAGLPEPRLTAADLADANSRLRAGGVPVLGPSARRSAA